MVTAQTEASSHHPPLASQMTGFVSFIVYCRMCTKKCFAIANSTHIYFLVDSLRDETLSQLYKNGTQGCWCVGPCAVTCVSSITMLWPFHATSVLCTLIVPIPSSAKSMLSCSSPSCEWMGSLSPSPVLPQYPPVSLGNQKISHSGVYIHALSHNIYGPHK